MPFGNTWPHGKYFYPCVFLLFMFPMFSEIQPGKTCKEKNVRAKGRAAVRLHITKDLAQGVSAQTEYPNVEEILKYLEHCRHSLGTPWK